MHHQVGAGDLGGPTNCPTSKPYVAQQTLFVRVSVICQRADKPTLSSHLGWPKGSPTSACRSWGQSAESPYDCLSFTRAWGNPDSGLALLVRKRWSWMGDPAGNRKHLGQSMPRVSTWRKLGCPKPQPRGLALITASPRATWLTSRPGEL